MERDGRPRGALPGGQLPAAHRPAGHREDAPGPDDRGEAARAGRGGAPGLEDALLGAEPVAICTVFTVFFEGRATWHQEPVARQGCLGRPARR